MLRAGELRSERLILRVGDSSDASALCDYFVRNAEYLRPFEPERPPGFETKAFWIEKLSVTDVTMREEERAIRFLLFRADDPSRVIGTAQLSNISRGIFLACNLGYSLDQHEQGQGLMTEAIERVCRFAFDDLGLHRVMANYMPENERSARVLKRCGFEIEGRARAYLKIAGRWEDHILTARISE